MSAVRMCDRCGNIFAEGAVGSSVGTGSRVVYVDGRKVTEQMPQDLCPVCTGEPIAPRFQAPETKALTRETRTIDGE